MIRFAFMKIRIKTIPVYKNRMKNMKISQLEFPHGLFLAPMAGVTDVPFRALCKKYGAEGVFTEMV